MPRRSKPFLGKTHRSPPQFMPCCGRFVDACSQVTGDGGPVPGAFSFCIGCGSLTIYEDDLKLRLPKPDEQQAAARHPAYRAVWLAWVALVAKRGAPPPDNYKGRA